MLTNTFYKSHITARITIRYVSSDSCAYIIPNDSPCIRNGLQNANATEMGYDKAQIIYLYALGIIYGCIGDSFDKLSAASERMGGFLMYNIYPLTTLSSSGVVVGAQARLAG